MIHFVTAADKKYYTRLTGLIGSIHEHCTDFSISVYDLGLHYEERNILSRVKNVTVKQVEQVNPYILSELPSHPHSIPENNPLVTGLYSWKPVILKQELDQHDAVIYLDAGTYIINDLAPLWEFVNSAGHWFLGICDINWMTTKYVIDTLNVPPEILSAQGVNAGMQGLTKKVYENYILPCYEYAKNIELFNDSGTASGGEASGRHDQTLFSIEAAKSNLRPNNPFHITTYRDEINPKITLIYHCRADSKYCDLKTLWT